MERNEGNWGWGGNWNNSGNFQNNRNWRNSSFDRTTTYYCPKSSCDNTVSNSGEYCSYHQQEQERERQEREEYERRERETQIGQERRRRLEYERERQTYLEYQRQQEERLRRERQERLEREQRREVEIRRLRAEEQRMIEEQMRKEREARMEYERKRAEEQRRIEQQRREFEARQKAELRRRNEELAERMRQLNLEEERKKREFEEKLRQPRYYTYRTRHDPVSPQYNNCNASSCQNKIDLGHDYCYNHANECQENNCLIRVLGSQIYCPSHKKQTLNDWRREDKITDEEISKLKEFNLNGEYTLKQLKEVLEEDAYINDSPIIPNTITDCSDFQTVIRDNLSNSLKRVRPKLALAVGGESQPPPKSDIVPFSTWFNADCATIVSKLNWMNFFDVWVAVRENPVRKMEGFIDIIWVSEYLDKNEARRRAAIVRREMNGECPVLCIAPSLQVFYNNSDYLFVNIIKIDLPINEDIVKNPNKYLLPLDIVERGGGSSSSSSSSSSGGSSHRHAAIYLGCDPKHRDGDERKHKVCHIFAPGPSRSQSALIGSSVASGFTVGSSASGSSGGSSSGGATLSSASFSEKKKAKTRIDTWREFLTKNPKELIRYRITIPFKKYEKEIEQIAKAVVTEFGKGNYHLIDRNCEHFAFAVSCGVNFSEQEQSNRDKWYRKFLYRRGDKIEKMDLEKEMNRSNKLFDNLTSGKINLEDIEESTTNREVTDKFKEINQWSKDRDLFAKEEPQEVQEAKVEIRVIIPPKYHNWK